MKCNVEIVYKNLRYKVLTIGKEKYILDIGGSSFWKMFFSFLFWIFPLKVYKVNDENLIKEIVAPTVEQKGVGWQTAFVAAISLGGGGLL